MRYLGILFILFGCTVQEAEEGIEIAECLLEETEQVLKLPSPKLPAPEPRINQTLPPIQLK